MLNLTLNSFISQEISSFDISPQLHQVSVCQTAQVPHRVLRGENQKKSQVLHKLDFFCESIVFTIFFQAENSSLRTLLERGLEKSFHLNMEVLRLLSLIRVWKSLQLTIPWPRWPRQPRQPHRQVEWELEDLQASISTMMTQKLVPRITIIR